MSASLENFIFDVDRCAECTISVMADFEGVVYRITFIPGILLGAQRAALCCGGYLYTFGFAVVFTEGVLVPEGEGR